ncbi:MAG: peptidylprolyl isomerase [Clostridia bacterium]|nr:peptidylprolyl isomerase [Clostridia bacterium]
MRKKNGNNTLSIILASALILVTAVCVVVLVLLLSGNTHKVEKGGVVLTIENTKIYENQFRFFSTLLLNQEDAQYRLEGETKLTQLNETLKEDTLNFAKEYIYRLREAKAAKITLSKEDVAELEQSFKTEYDKQKKVGTRILKGDAYYDYYYGLTKKQYTQFWKDWAVIEKYNAQCEANADTGIDNQERAYEEYKDYLAGCNATVLPISLQDLTEAQKQEKVKLAQELAQKIQSGSDMVALIKKHCTDESILACNGSVRITKLMETSFEKIYDWSVNAQVGEISVVETEKEVYVLRADSFATFDTLKDTEEMKEWTRLFCVQEETANLLRSNKYKVTVNTENYTDVDLTSLLQKALSNWN